MTRLAIGSDFNEEKPLRDDPPLTTFRQACILDRVLKEKQDSGAGSKIALVNEHGAATQQVAMPLQRDVDDRVEKWMARADEGGQRLARGRDQCLLESDTLVAWQDRFAQADQAVAIAHRSGHIGDLVPVRFSLLGNAAEPPESFKEERLHIVRLKTPCFGALHLLADPMDP